MAAAHARPWLIGFLILTCAACNQGRVQSGQNYEGPTLPHPDRILVRDFAVVPEDVRLDQGIRARLTQALSDTPASATKVQTARTATSSLATDLVRDLRGYGLPAERAFGSEVPSTENVVLVEGQIVSIDQGNRTRRTLVGLGAGKSSLGADVQVFYQRGPAKPQLLETFQADADSGHAPGAAETMGAGGAAGTGVAASAATSLGLHEVSERRQAGDTDNARRVADALAPKLRQLFQSQGWMQAAGR